MTRVTFKGVMYKMQKVEFTKLLRYEANLPLKLAKQITDDLLEGKIRFIEMDTVNDAQFIVEKATSLGVNCEISNDI